MQDTPAFGPRIRLAELPAGAEHAFDIRPDADMRAAIAAELGLGALRKLRLAGRLVPVGRQDWRLQAELGATVVQPCVVTLEPVTTRIDEPVTRTYLAEQPELPEDDEIEMPEDETAEALPAVLDLGAVMVEALALAVPAYPHAEGVDPVNQSFAAPGVTPVSDEQAKPFAGLSALKAKLENDDD